MSAALNGAFSSSIILGGPSCVSEQAEGFLNSFSQLGGVGGGVVKRIFGANRWETTSKFADWVIGEGYLACNGAGFASGMLPYDALGGGAVQGRTGSVLILVSDSSAASAVNPLQNADVSTVRIYGGKGAVSSAVRLCIATDLGFYPTDIGGLRIYLDAGHGWNSDNNGLFDPGAMSGGYREADLTAELANLVAKELRETYGVEVFVNDDGGWYKLRQEEALSLGCDLLVSIHFNAGGGTGSESYIHSHNAACFSANFQDLVHPALVSGTGLTDRGQHVAQLAVCGGSVSAVLLEVGFIDSESDMKTYQARKAFVAQEIARGIVGR